MCHLFLDHRESNFLFFPCDQISEITLLRAPIPKLLNFKPETTFFQHTCGILSQKIILLHSYVKSLLSLHFRVQCVGRADVSLRPIIQYFEIYIYEMHIAQLTMKNNRFQTKHVFSVVLVKNQHLHHYNSFRMGSFQIAHNDVDIKVTIVVQFDKGHQSQICYKEHKT